jgi:hypothetical protein
MNSFTVKFNKRNPNPLQPRITQKETTTITFPLDYYLVVREDGIEIISIPDFVKVIDKVTLLIHLDFDFVPKGENFKEVYKYNYETNNWDSCCVTIEEDGKPVVRRSEADRKIPNKDEMTVTLGVDQYLIRLENKESVILSVPDFTPYFDTVNLESFSLTYTFDKEIVDKVKKWDYETETWIDI